MLNHNHAKLIEDDDTRANLLVVTSPDGLLLGQKQRGFGLGKLVLPGGKEKFIDGFTKRPPLEDAQEELLEETGLFLPASSFNQTSQLYISQEDGEGLDVLVAKAHLDTTPKVGDSDELKAVGWHPLHELPYEDMPKDYRLWLPFVLAGYTVNAFLLNTTSDHSGSRVYGQLHSGDKLGNLELLTEIQ